MTDPTIQALGVQWRYTHEVAAKLDAKPEIVLQRLKNLLKAGRIEHRVYKHDHAALRRSQWRRKAVRR